MGPLLAPNEKDPNMAKPGNYSRERDARRAARDKGLKDDEFELIQGPKGWTWRQKKKYVKVEGAKLHVSEKPTGIVRVNEPTDIQNVVKESSTGRFRYVDSDSGEVSMESFETLAEATLALTFAKPPPIIAQATPEGVVLPTLPVAEQPVVLEKAAEAAGLHLVNEKRICPNCERSVDTFISGETLRYVEHPFGDEDTIDQSICNMSEEEVTNVRNTGAPQSDFKPHELAQIQQVDPLPSGTFSPDSLPRREVIPRVHRSTVERPSKKVWEIAEAMTKENPKVSRKEVLAECVRQGIAYFTARTQFQVWTKVMRESNANSDEVNKD